MIALIIHLLIVVRIRLLSLPVQSLACGEPLVAMTHHACMGLPTAQLGLVHHRGLVEESCVPLVGEEALLLAIQKDVPSREEKDFRELDRDEPLEPCAFLVEDSELVDAVFTSG